LVWFKWFKDCDHRSHQSSFLSFNIHCIATHERELQMTFKNLKGLLTAAAIIAAGCSTALGQSGSAGGSIGNDDKALSGTRQTPQSNEPDHSSQRSNKASGEGGRSAPRRGGAARGGFDGAWIFVGASTNCQGTGSVSAVISGGTVSGPGTSGSVSASGAYRATSVFGDRSQLTATGRLSGSGGSGTYMRTDGCGGRWTASRQ
jgi:hypothetical protein